MEVHDYSWDIWDELKYCFKTKKAAIEYVNKKKKEGLYNFYIEVKTLQD